MYFFLSEAFKFPCHLSGAGPALPAWLQRFIEERRSRRNLQALLEHLSALDDRTLTDMGVNPDHVPRQANRDFHANAFGVCGRLTVNPWEGRQS